MEILDIENCKKIKELPKGIFNLTNLEVLYIENYRNLIELPNDTNNLKTLYIYFDNLTKIPNEIGI